MSRLELFLAAGTIVNNVKSKNVDPAIELMKKYHDEGCDCGVPMTDLEATELAACIADRNGPGLLELNKEQEAKRRGQ